MFGLSPLPRTLAAALRDAGDKKLEVRVSAVRDLGRHAREGADVAVERLRRVLSEDSAVAVRAEAAVALADAGARAALPALVEAAGRDDAPRVRQMALVALGELGQADDEDATRVIERALRDEQPELRFQALIAFAQLQGAGALDVLHRFVRDVLTEGEIGDSLYMIESGRVKVFIGDEEGREIILKLLGTGHFFGEMAMIDQQPRSASVTTLEPSTFLILSHHAFEHCVERAPRIANMVLRVLAQRVREADRKIGTLALMDVYGRVASTLLELAVNQNGKLVVSEKLSQQDLANMVGASREMVNRILKDLSERGFIAVESKSITIINRELPPSL